MLEFEKFFRDPLYGFIGLTHKEVELLSTPVVQRLRRIKQLGNTHLVYPSACHSRFEHTLGVLHIANRMAEKLSLSDGEIEIVRCAALLHDIGHGPLSHNFETVLKNVNKKEISHEDITLRIIKEDSEIDKILAGLKDDVLSLFDEKNDTANSKIISGNIDADRLDYLRRDSYHTGVAYGIFDLERILHTIQKIVDGERSEIAILKKGQDAIESYRLARFLMHTQVYYHHVRAISDNMLNRAVEIAINDGTLRDDLLKFDSSDFLENYLSLDDNRLFIKILSNKESNAFKLINDLENRNLLKRGYEIDLRKLNPMKIRKIMRLKPEDFKKLEGKLAQKCSCDKDFIIVHLQKIENTLYKSSYEFFKSGETPILILDNDGLHEIEKESHIFGSQEPLLKLYIFCPEENKSQIREFAEDILL
ncbi:Deoxyguanosinetriphosphate triphosphohydrolase-like protein [uncultured archaeon]|nr:Deoxyguanosinetriphosphate triphosphohydrolase-like protein [uncultured archaeon]